MCSYESTICSSEHGDQREPSDGPWRSGGSALRLWEVGALTAERGREEEGRWLHQ